MGILTRNSLPNLKRRTMQREDMPFEEGLMHKVLQNFQLSLKYYKIKTRLLDE